MIRSHADRPRPFLAQLAWNANFIEDKFQLLKQFARQQLAEDFDITEICWRIWQRMPWFGQ